MNPLAICAGVAVGQVAGIVAEVIVDLRQRLHAAEQARDSYAVELRHYQERDIDLAGFSCRCIECGVTFDDPLTAITHLRSHEATKGQL
jgi:hypothetical protein